MSLLHTYLPQDRLRALARNETLPDRTTGSALFADISGFTPLTEKLRQELGPRRGAEALSQQLEAVYTALITPVEKYGGSVIGFAGDAMLCWFDEKEDWRIGGFSNPLILQPSTISVECALALQAAMQAFPQLALKVSVATGPARRLVVGDPQFNYLDVLAGATITRTATAEHLAQQGEVLIDEASAQTLGDAVSITEWRTEGEARFAVVEKLEIGGLGHLEIPQFSNPPISPLLVARFILPAVYERETSGQGSFLTEFRPCVAVFVRFMGIDYDADDAQPHLDAFIRQVQAIASRYDGTLIDLTIGDKGSYAYIVLGALTAHEDDARRAVKIALALHNAAAHFPFLTPLQIGITQGTLRTGAYGGVTRRTYGALGDEVNLAARLMQAALPGETLISETVHKAIAPHFICQPHPPLKLKGKAALQTVFTVSSERHQRALRLQEPHYALPMVGRQAELQTIGEKLALTRQGQSQIIGLVAEAGLGKSRLVAEAVRLAQSQGFVGYGGACQSDAINTPYQVWKGVWQAFFDVEPLLPVAEQQRQLEAAIDVYAPARRQAMPLLGILLNLDLPDNDFTRHLEPRYRQSALNALLEDCLRIAAQQAPVLMVLEDLHWIDALSLQLLEELATTLREVAVGFVLAYRPPHLAQALSPRYEALPNFTKVELHELTPPEAAQVLQAKLRQKYPTATDALPATVVEMLTGRAQGNPFYLEELLNYLHDRGFDPHVPADLDKIELPHSLHALILSRIDQLTEREKTTLRVASIIGRLFYAEWLTGYYPALGPLPTVKADLTQLAEMDITPLDTPEPELTYLFKHIVTHEVTYESLPFATRTKLHEQLARYLENVQTQNFESLLDAIAFHYARSNNIAKQREYFQKAGDAAQAIYANDAALDYFAKLLPLLTEPQEQIDLHFKRGEILFLTGQWTEAEPAYQTALRLAQHNRNGLASVRCQKALSKLFRFREADARLARNWAEQALAGAETLADPHLWTQCACELAIVDFILEDYPHAQARFESALPLTRAQGDLKTLIEVLRLLTTLAFMRSDYATGRALSNEALVLARQLADKHLLVETLSTYTSSLAEQGLYHTAQAANTEQLALAREIGNKFFEALALIYAGALALQLGWLTQAHRLYEQVLPVARLIPNSSAQIIEILAGQGELGFEQGDYVTAHRLWAEAATLVREINYKGAIASTAHDLGRLALATGQLTAAEVHFAEALQIYQELESRNDINRLNASWAMLAALQDQSAQAKQLSVDTVAAMRQLGNPVNLAYALGKLGFVALHQQAHTEAQAHYLEALRLYAPSEYRGYDWAEAWAGLACAFLRQPATCARGVQVAAVAEKILRDMGAVLYPLFRTPLDEALALAKESLGEAAFNAAWEAGTVKGATLDWDATLQELLNE